MPERTRQAFNAKEGTISTLEECYTTRKDCRACGGSIEVVLSLGDQYLPRFTKEIDLSLPKAPLSLARCAACGLLQLQHSVKPDAVFRDYWYQTSINKTMMNAMTDIVRDAVAYHRSGKWVDIGANDGYLLSQVPQSFQRIACEPSNQAEKAKKHADLVVQNYFDGQEAFEDAKIITSAAMFYDVEDPNQFVRNIHRCLADDGIWINQLNDSPTMLEKNDFAAICHEHLCYYDVRTLERIYRQNGMSIINVTQNDVNGGSVRITAVKSNRPHQKADLMGYGSPSLSDVGEFAQRVIKWKANLTAVLHGLGRPLWVYGASTKGMVMLQYLDLNDHFVAVADRNPAKFGLYMAGCWLPIVDEQTMRKEKPEYVLVLPYAFRKEFDEREKGLRSTGTTLIYPFPDVSFVL